MVGTTSPDGKWHAYTDGKSGRLVVFDLTRRRVLAKLGQVTAGSCDALAWSADSGQIAYLVDTTGKNVGDDFRIEVYDLATKKTRRVGGVAPCRFRFDSVGHLVWTPWNGGEIRRDDDPQPLAPVQGYALWIFGPAPYAVRSKELKDVVYYIQPPSNTPGDTAHFVRVVLATGAATDLTAHLPKHFTAQLVDSRGGLCGFADDKLVCIDPDAREPVVLAAGMQQPFWFGTIENFSFSPSGNRLVFGDIDQHGNRGLYVVDRGDKTPRMLARDVGKARAATFVGEDAVLLSDPLGPAPLVRVDVATGKQTTVSPVDAEWTEPVVSHSGTTLMLGRENDATRDLWVMYR